MNLPTSLLETVIGLEDVYMSAFPFGPNSSEGLGECKIHSGGRVLIEYNIAVLVLSENPDNRRQACDLQIVLANVPSAPGICLAVSSAFRERAPRSCICRDAATYAQTACICVLIVCLMRRVGSGRRFQSGTNQRKAVLEIEPTR
jgi:hypothetical protein